MATTTNYGWETPDDTDLVKDGAAAIRTLGSSIDTSFVDLKGGTTGQNLRKASNTDLDFTFAGDATNTVVDAAGDLLYGTANDTLGRLGIGTAGQILKVNSGATAPEWGAAGGAMTLINTGGTTLTGASVVISTIPATYKNLQLIIRDFLPETDNKGIGLRYNGDSNTRYAIIFANAQEGQTFDRTQLDLGYANDNSVADGFIVVDIYDYANTTTYKVSDSLLVTTNPTTTSQINMRRGFGVYNQTGAISSITLIPETGNFTSGTAFLYGVS